MTKRVALALALPLALLAAAVGQTQPGRETEVRKARRPVPNQYIVVVEDGEDPQVVADLTEVAHSARRARVFRHALRGFSIRLSPDAAERLAEDPRVRFVEEDSRIQVTQSPAVWGLDRIDQRVGPLDGVYNIQAFGTGVFVHVVDTGIRWSHVEFDGRASVAADYVDDDDDDDPFDIGNDDSDPLTADGTDCHGHGTHVAGTIGGATYGVATNTTLLAHRVLDCSGNGTVSGVIAAVDAITASHNRPAVVNMSLGVAVSDALDEAVRQSIQAGITYVIAAGNDGLALLDSPARVTEAITVAATDASDAKPSFSNYGTAVDLFAPGVGITSASRASDTATTVLSGTSMAAPHVAGVAALLLELQPMLTPADVQNAILAAATPNVVVAAGGGSPNRLLFSDLTQASAPHVDLRRPVEVERVLNGFPYPIQWQAADPDGIQGFDVLLSLDGGASFEPVAECMGLAAEQRQCTWLSPAPVSTTARIRVIARDLTGDAAFDQLFSNFSIVVRPELVVSQVSHPVQPLAPGNSFTITDVVQNLGNASAPASSTRYYVSLDSSKGADDLRLAVGRAVPVLAAGEQSSGTAVVTLSSSMPVGKYTLFACADDGGAVTEANETNNCTAAATLLTVELPDLREVSLSGVPLSASAGSSFPVTGTVTNQGIGPAASSSTRFYLSLNTVKDTADLLMNGTRAVPILTAGASKASTTTVTVPTTAPGGTYYVIACADGGLKVRETNEGNNCLAGTSLTVGRADLVVTTMTNPPASAAPNTSFSLTTSVQNLGPVTAGASTLRFYLSADVTRNSGDLLISGTRSIATLLAGQSSTAATTVTVPSTTSPGTFYVLACADDQLKVLESVENNCLAAATAVLVARPDLAQTSVSGPPPTATPGSSFAVSGSVQNRSQVSAAASTTRYYLSVDAVKDATDILLIGTRGVPLLAPGVSSALGRSVTVPLATPLGRFYVITCADDLFKLIESDEINNCRSTSSTLLITWPDLVTSAVSKPPATVLRGQVISITDTVVNQGQHVAGSSTTRYYLSVDTTKDSTDTLLTVTRAIGALAIGQASTGSRQLTIPTSVSFGSYVVLACADDLQQIGELDNGNNCFGSAALAVNSPNTQPIANAGSDSEISPGVVVQLDGRGSSDADGNPLTYAWTLLATPPGSETALSSGSSLTPSFVPDIAGQYVVRLIVHDGRDFSAPDVVTFATSGATRFAALGDTGLGDAGQYAGAALLKNTCQRSGCDFVVLLGDNIYQSGVESVTDEQFNTKFELPYADVAVPFYAVLGNHDYGNGGTGDEFHKGQFQVDYSTRSTKWRMPAAYYRFTQGDVEFFALDTNMQMYGQEAQQRVDIAAWLGASTAPWKIALGHHPYRSNGSHGNAGSYNGTSGIPVTSGDGVKSFDEDIVCGRVDVMLSGHDHNLQWLQPNGTCLGTELIVSGAAANPKSLRSPTSANYNETYFQAAQLGFVYIVVTANQFTAEFVGSNGQTLYVRTLTKSP